MKLSEELEYRGLINQTTFKDIDVINHSPITFYFGADPSADSLQIGNLAAAMLVRHFLNHGHKAVLLVGGATGLIGDPDGKDSERDLLTKEQVEINKKAIAKQYKKTFAGQDFDLVDNYDWFKELNYLEFLRIVGKNVPLRTMLGRDFVQSRIGEDGNGISYAEFSYSLIQGYDFLHLHNEKGVTLQLAGADQWGNSIAGVDLIRRSTGKEANILTIPLVINKATGKKFGKSESGTIWLDENKTTITSFYQFWINLSDEGIEDYIKIYTLLSKEEIDDLIKEHSKDTSKRLAQKTLAEAVTTLVHGKDKMNLARKITEYLTGISKIGQASSNHLEQLRIELPHLRVNPNSSIIEALKLTGLASSNSEARQFIKGNAITINNQSISRDNFIDSDFLESKLLLRRGKAYKDSALIELK